jgi:hypothetical protein
VSVPATAYPPFTLTQGGSFGLVGANVKDGSSAYTTVQGSLQNPTAAQDAAHRGYPGTIAPIQPILGNVQNPTAAQDAAHRGYFGDVGYGIGVRLFPTATPSTSHPATSAPAPSYTVPRIIPTTIRPITVTTRGRVA